MLFSDLVILLKLKGYEYLERKEEDGPVSVYAVKEGKEIYLGVKELILEFGINLFVKNETYQKL